MGIGAQGAGKGGNASAPQPQGTNTAIPGAYPPPQQGSAQQQSFGGKGGGKGGGMGGQMGNPYQYQNFGINQQQNPMGQMGGYYTPIPNQMPQSPYQPWSSYQYGQSPIQSGQQFWGSNPQQQVNAFNQATGASMPATTAPAAANTTAATPSTMLPGVQGQVSNNFGSKGGQGAANLG